MTDLECAYEVERWNAAQRMLRGDEAAPPSDEWVAWAQGAAEALKAFVGTDDEEGPSATGGLIWPTIPEDAVPVTAEDLFGKEATADAGSID